MTGCVESVKELIRCSGGKCFFQVYVIPKAQETFLELRDGELVFNSSASCKRHGVNSDLMRFFRNVFSGGVEMVRGVRERMKTLTVEGLSHEEVAVRICGALGSGRKSQ
ncbi:MAG: hypothetical protein J7L55_04950 [Desulfurococcales archaeon]|nr:hypothetical protein [Desulfurococcales archaeon]